MKPSVRRRRPEPNIYLHGNDILGAISRYGTTTTVAPTTTTYRAPTTTTVAPAPAPAPAPTTYRAPLVTTVAPAPTPAPTTAIRTSTVTTVAPPPPTVRPAITESRIVAPSPTARAAVLETRTLAPAPRSASSFESRTEATRPFKASVAEVKAAEARKAGEAKAAEAKKRSSAAKSAAASRLIAAGQRLAKHKRGRTGSKLVSLGRKASKKATSVQGVLDTILGAFTTAQIAVMEVSWELAVAALAAAADLAANVYALADRLQITDPALAKEGYAIGDQAQALIDQYGGDAIFDAYDSSIGGQVARVQSEAAAWQARAQEALATGAPAAAAASATSASSQTEENVPWMDAGAGSGDFGGGGGGGGGSGGGGGGGGGGGDGGGDAEAEQAAAEMAAEAGGGGGGGGGGVDWGEETDRDAVDEQRDGGVPEGGGGGGAYAAEAAVEEAAVEEPAPEEGEKPLAQGDKVTSSEKSEKGEGVIQLIFPDAADVLWNDGETTSEPLTALTRVVVEEEPEVMGSNVYIHGYDVLAGDFGSGGAPSAAMDYGPSIGPGTVYTDASTIRAVQTALTARGISPGPIDGVFGPQTEAALFKFSGKHGPPDGATLSALGVAPGGASTGGGQGVPSSGVVKPIKDWLSKAFGGGTPVSYAPTAAGPTPGPMTSALVPMKPGAPGFWSQPAWNGAPFKRWQAGTAIGGTVAILAGLTLAVRR